MGRSSGNCSECGSVLSASLRHCLTCSADAGAPNVRASQTIENVKQLTSRYETSRTAASERGCLNEFLHLESIIKEKSGVVITMPPAFARRMFEDPHSLYANYERVVGGKIRKPAEPARDRHRCGVGGILFGSYADSIVYGALSLSQIGLSTYGPVHCRLRTVAIQKRTSFLESNSYNFVKAHAILAGDKMPDGHWACWELRHMLVLSKLGTGISGGQSDLDLEKMLIHSDEKNRENDEFIEAHIFETFDSKAIESITLAPGANLTKGEQIDFEIALAEFQRLRSK